jgi:hypothetical protein
MQELDELRPAPRRTPTIVLWLMAAVCCIGGLLLLDAVQKDRANADPDARHPRVGLSAKASPAKRPTGQRPSGEPPGLSELQVP